MPSRTSDLHIFHFVSVDPKPSSAVLADMPNFRSTTPRGGASKYGIWLYKHFYGLNSELKNKPGPKTMRIKIKHRNSLWEYDVSISKGNSYYNEFVDSDNVRQKFEKSLKATAHSVKRHMNNTITNSKKSKRSKN